MKLSPSHSSSSYTSTSHTPYSTPLRSLPSGPRLPERMRLVLLYGSICSLHLFLLGRSAPVSGVRTRELQVSPTCSFLLAVGGAAWTSSTQDGSYAGSACPAASRGQAASSLAPFARFRCCNVSARFHKLVKPGEVGLNQQPWCVCA